MTGARVLFMLTWASLCLALLPATTGCTLCNDSPAAKSSMTASANGSDSANIANSSAHAQPLTLEFFIASVQQDAEFSRRYMTQDLFPIYLQEEPLVTLEHIARASFRETESGKPAVLLELNEKGRNIMRRQASQYVGRFLAVSLDNQIIYTPKVNSPLTRYLIIIPPPPEVSGQTIDALIARINRSAENLANK